MRRAILKYCIGFLVYDGQSLVNSKLKFVQLYGRSMQEPGLSVDRARNRSHVFRRPGLDLLLTARFLLRPRGHARRSGLLLVFQFDSVASLQRRTSCRYVSPVIFWGGRHVDGRLGKLVTHGRIIHVTLLTVTRLAPANGNDLVLGVILTRSLAGSMSHS